MAQVKTKLLTKLELETIVKLMQTLNYYQVLKVSPVASEDEIREAFHREALSFHPDQYFSLGDQALLDLAKLAYAKVTEAYRTLSAREKRMSYDLSLNPSEENLDEESTIDENAITSVKKKPAWASSSPGEKFFKMADQAYKSGDTKGALVNIQIALSSDPNNSGYKILKSRIEADLKKK